MHARISSTSRALAAAVLALGLSATAFAQQGAQLRLDSLDALEGRADKVVDVTLGEDLLKGLGPMFSKLGQGQNDRDLEKARAFVKELRGVYVRSYEFETENAYSQADVEAIRSQLRGPGWSRIAGVRSKKQGENAEVYVLTEGGKMAGLVVLAAEPKELTVVNLVGTFDLERLSDFDGNFGMPGVRIERDPTTGN